MDTREGVINKSYQNALQLEPENFITSFQVCSTPILQEIQSIIPTVVGSLTYMHVMAFLKLKLTHLLHRRCLEDLICGFFTNSFYWWKTNTESLEAQNII